MPQTLTKQSKHLKELAVTTYQNLVTDISRIYEDAQDSTMIAVNKIRNQAYWMIGEHIVKVEQDGELKAAYGSNLIENLSKDLSVKYSNGFSATNIWAMRKFYVTHPILQPATELSWSHYKILLTIPNDDVRTAYERRAIAGGWSKRDLKQALAKNQVELEASEGIEPDEVLPVKEEKQAKLQVGRGVLNTYKLVEIKNRVGVESSFVLDCGFKVFSEFSVSNVQYKIGDVLEATHKDGESWFKNSDVTKRQMYTFKAFVERVVDGDTLLVNIDLGFGQWTQQRLRLKGIDAPALSTKRGQKTKEVVESILSQCPFIVVKTYQVDRYDRYITDVFYLPDELDASVIAVKGKYLNQELLDQRLAVLF